MQKCSWRAAKGAPATDPAQRRKGLAGRLEPIASDADGASSQVNKGDVTDVTLQDRRGNTATETRATGP